MKVKNMLFQPLELDFEKDYVVRLNARDEGEIKDKYVDHPVFKRNKKDLQILTQPKAKKEKATDKQE